ncbi:MAG TPA: hypothetical protein VGK00_09285 [Anaerolineales bacterium]
MNSQTRNNIFSAFLLSAVLTAVVWLTGDVLHSRFDIVNVKYYTFFYQWQTRNPTFVAYLSAWAGYALHNIAVWLIIFLARREKPKFSSGFRWFNWMMLAVNLGFFGLHWIQTQVWYDGLAISVPEVTSQGSVILMLVFILILEAPRRGLFFGKKIKFHARFLKIVREYHGYLFSWAVIYTFWYHPMENTFGHLAGFFYMFLLLSQSVLIFNRAHINKWWTFALEALVMVHGTVVAIYQGKGMWPMFAFGFGALIVLTQMHGLGLNTFVKRMVAIGFLIAALSTYALLGRLPMLHQVMWISITEYGLVAVFYMFFLGSHWIYERFANKKITAETNLS